MNPQMTPYGQPSQGWPQNPSSVNGNPQMVTNQMSNMNLGPKPGLNGPSFQNQPVSAMPPHSMPVQPGVSQAPMPPQMQYIKNGSQNNENNNRNLSANFPLPNGHQQQQTSEPAFLGVSNNNVGPPGHVPNLPPNTFPQPIAESKRPGELQQQPLMANQAAQSFLPTPGHRIPPQPQVNLGVSHGAPLPVQNILPKSGQQYPSQLGSQYPPGQAFQQQPGQQFQQQQQASQQFAPPSVNQFSPQQVKQFPPQSGNQFPPQPGQQFQSQIADQRLPTQPLGMPHMPPPIQQMQGSYPTGNFPPNQQSIQGKGYNQPQPGMYNAMPGQQYSGGQPGQQYPPPGGMAPSSQQRRLDPDQMPNPIQVISENQRSCGGVFETNQAGLVPPLVTTDFLTQDQGNSGPRYIRSSMYNVPTTTEMMKQSAVPFTLIISPMAKPIEKELAPPIVDLGEIGPIRCIRCKAYMCPFMQFIDGGRRFQCLLCKATTEVPPEYFQHLDHTGQRVDKYERPELVLGTYEFVATKDYCRNNVPPKPPAMVFVIDVSYNNIKSGLVHLLCSEMKNIIKNLPIDEGQDRSVMKVGFITYNNTVHFYNIKSNLAQPQMMVVGDLQEMFMPLLDGFLCDPEESSAVIDSLMEQIPKMFGDTRETETILLPALQAGLEALKASECAGKLLVFHSSLPIADAPGKLKNRDERKLLGTEKEKTVLTPQSTIYNMLGQDCVGVGVSVDLFVFNNSYIDLATIGQVSRLTGGEIYKYTYFQADIDGQRLIADLVKNISRPIAFEAVMRVRTSTGIRPTDFFGHFFMGNTTDMDIASIDSDKSIAIEIKHDDKLSPEENVYLQVALLYTSCGGQRRLRILNLSLKTCTQLADLFRSCDLDTTILFFAKQGLFKLLENTPKAIKDGLISRAAQILACYRKNCASPSSSGQLILPECMKLLPLYVSCLLKNDAFSGGSDLTLDDRSFVMYFVMSMDLPTSVQYFYPRLIPIHDADVDETNIPAAVRSTADKMLEDGAYLIENGIHMFMWLGVGLPSEFTQSVFGAQCTQQIDTDRSGLPVFDNPLSRRVRGIVDSIQNEKHRCMRLTLVKQRDKLENVLRHFLVEDRGTTDGSASYVDFLCQMHKEIRQLLS